MADTYVLTVAGTSFRQEAVAKAKIGDDCLLLREPGNPHDTNAVKVILKDDNQQLGYVPRKVSAVVTEAILEGFPIAAKICSINAIGRGPEKWVQIEVTL